MEQTAEDRTAALEKRENALKADRLRFELGAALGGAGCKPEALKDAVAIMAGSSSPVFNDDDGRLVSLTLGDEEFDSAADAAKHFLSSREHFVAPREDKKTATPPAATKGPEQLVSDAFSQSKPATAPAAPSKLTGSLDQLLAAGTTPADLAAAGWATPPKR